MIHRYTGIDPQQVGKESQNEPQEDIVATYIKQQEKLNELRKLLSQIVESQPEKPFIILVDELDRARPDYSVHFIEAIKHIFSVQGICFVLAVDRKRMEQSVEQLFGKIDFDNYYRRFVQREISLPPIKANHFGLVLDKIGKKYHDIFPKNYIDDIKDDFVFIVGMLDFTPREVEQVCDLYLQLFSTNNIKKINNHLWLVATLFLVAINVKDRENLFHQIGTGEITTEKLGEELKKYKLGFALQNNASKWNFLVRTVLAANLDENNESGIAQAEAVFRSIKDARGSGLSITDTLKDMWQGASPHFRPFSHIYKKLQKLQFLLD